MPVGPFDELTVRARPGGGLWSEADPGSGDPWVGAAVPVAALARTVGRWGRHKFREGHEGWERHERLPESGRDRH